MSDGRTESSRAASEANAVLDARTDMDLRDYFAGQALSGICSASVEPAHGLAMQRRIAETAYQIADAMMARRGEQSE